MGSGGIRLRNNDWLNGWLMAEGRFLLTYDGDDHDELGGRCYMAFGVLGRVGLSKKSLIACTWRLSTYDTE
jgi:hypothetical protein